MLSLYDNSIPIEKGGKMSEKLLPKFLTEKVAKRAISLAGNITQFLLENASGCHVVILVPSMCDNDYPLQNIEAHVLYERSFGKREEWSHNFEEIAQCKALQLWNNRNNDQTDCMPHLLFPGDTPYWGGVWRKGIVVTCSGFKPYIDKMLAGVIADLCIGFAYEAYDAWRKLHPDLDFLEN